MFSHLFLLTCAAGIHYLERPRIARHAHHHVVRGNAGLGDHRQRRQGLSKVNMTTQTLTLRTSRIGVLVPIVPLAMQDIGHEDDVVNERGRSLD